MYDNITSPIQYYKREQRPGTPQTPGSRRSLARDVYHMSPAASGYHQQQFDQQAYPGSPQLLLDETVTLQESLWNVSERYPAKNEQIDDVQYTQGTARSGTPPRLGQVTAPLSPGTSSNSTTPTQNSVSGTPQKKSAPSTHAWSSLAMANEMRKIDSPLKDMYGRQDDPMDYDIANGFSRPSLDSAARKMDMSSSAARRLSEHGSLQSEYVGEEQESPISSRPGSSGRLAPRRTPEATPRSQNDPWVGHSGRHISGGMVGVFGHSSRDATEPRHSPTYHVSAPLPPYIASAAEVPSPTWAQLDMLTSQAAQVPLPASPSRRSQDLVREFDSLNSPRPSGGRHAETPRNNPLGFMDPLTDDLIEFDTPPHTKNPSHSSQHAPPPHMDTPSARPRNVPSQTASLMDAYIAPPTPNSVSRYSEKELNEIKWQMEEAFQKRLGEVELERQKLKKEVETLKTDAEKNDRLYKTFKYEKDVEIDRLEQEVDVLRQERKDQQMRNMHLAAEKSRLEADLAERRLRSVQLEEENQRLRSKDEWFQSHIHEHKTLLAEAKRSNEMIKMQVQQELMKCAEQVERLKAEFLTEKKTMDVQLAESRFKIEALEIEQRRWQELERIYKGA
ncbi:hypothetical protein HDU85_006823 [Gaertneriomyces sp. JEL0708]|nr:hypothetical protein HDU85_006823 [Gaertneriomyces sp. JEL0708]